MKTSPRQIVFVRHAESQANAGLATSVPEAISLTPRGGLQALALAEGFPFEPGLIIASPYLRARQTARPLTNRYPAARLEIWPVQEFTYLCPARCKATTTGDRLPMVREYWARGNAAHCDGDGAESLDGFLSRVRAQTCRLLACPEPRVAVVSHAQFIGAVLWLARRPGCPERLDPARMADFRAFIEAAPLANTQIVPLPPEADLPFFHFTPRAVEL